MIVSISDLIFSASVLGTDKINAAMVSVMNSSSTFQNLFAVASANGIPIRIGDPTEESGTFFLSTKTPSTPNGSIVIDPNDFTNPTFIADPRVLVARIAHELAHAADSVKANTVVGTDGLAPTPTDPNNIGPADYNSKRGKDEGLGLTQEFFVAKELGLGTFSGGNALFKKMDAVYGQLASAGLSAAEVTTALTFIAGTTGRNDAPSTNEGLNSGLTYGQVDIKTFIVRKLGFTDASGNAIDSKDYPTSNIVEYAQNDDGSYRISGIDPRTGELVTKEYESESDGKSKLFSTTRATVSDDGSRLQTITYEDGRPSVTQTVGSDNIAIQPPKNWFQKLFSESIDTNGDGVADVTVSAAPTTSGTDFTLQPLGHTEGGVTLTMTGDVSSGHWSVALTDSNRQLLSATSGQTFDDGSSLSTTTYPNGNSQTFTTNSDGSLYQRTDTQLQPDGSSQSRTYNGSNQLISASNKQVFDDGSSIETITSSAGVVRRTTDIDGNVDDVAVESGGINIGQAIGTTIDFLSLVRAIQTGEPLPILVSGLRLANDLSSLNGSSNLNLSGAANVGSGILSLLSLNAALERGDTLGAITAGAQTLSFGAAAYTDFLVAQNGGDAIGALIENTDAFAFAEGLGEALPYLNLINSIANGDVAGTAVAALSIYGVPYIGWAYAVYSIIDSLFGDDEPDIPDPWGNGSFVWNGNGISFVSTGETGGNEAVSNVMGGVIATMNALIERQRQQNPGSSLGIIPNRMPGVGYDTTGYRYTDIDPLTGGEKHPGLRFDTSGRPYNATPGSPESFQSITEGMVRSALGRGAIAPLWEVQTAKLQTDAGDPKAGLTEEERAGRDGQLAPPVTGTTQKFRPVVLDLDSDGIETTTRAQGISFDVDDSGYFKQTAWVKPDDGFLVLDRNLNDSFDSGRELFSNGKVTLGRRGLAGMAWVDSNYDGRLTAADPVWNELKVWKDADQDGVRDAGEAQSLSALGVSELNYAMGTFTQNGAHKQLGSPDLEADKDGSRFTVVPEGILVQASVDGRLSLLVTRIDDRTAIEVNRDGITGFEDIETIVSSTDLLANDTLGGFAGSNLTVTGVSHFRRGTGYLGANGFVHFTPQKVGARRYESNSCLRKMHKGYRHISSIDFLVGPANSACWRLEAGNGGNYSLFIGERPGRARPTNSIRRE